MLTSMARRPPTHAHHMNGLHHQPYQSKSNDDDNDDNEEERDVRRARSRVLANKLSESLLNRSSSAPSTPSNKEESIEQRIKSAIDICDTDTLRQVYCQSSCSISIERRFKSGGWTALIHAAYACHYPLVSLFVLELNADVNSQSSEQMSPLMACCMSSHSKSSTTNGNDEQLRICRFLLEHGAEIEPSSDVIDDKLMTPLMLAARFGCSPPLIRLLVEYGAKIDRRDVKGWCPLIMAAQHGHLGSVEALIRSGADPKSTTNNGLTALDIARHLKQEAIVQFLLLEQMQSLQTFPPTMPETTVHSGNEQPAPSSSDEQSWKSAACLGVATVLAGALLLGLVFLRSSR